MPGAGRGPGGGEVKKRHSMRKTTNRRGRASHAGAPTNVRRAREPASLDIAIIGLAGRYPEARDLAEFWTNVRDGKDCIREIPKARWDHDVYFDEDRGKPGKTYSKWGGFIDGVDEFDPLFFGISPREAETMDPQERLFLQCVYAALEDAGYTRGQLAPSGADSRNSVGVYVGVTWHEYRYCGVEDHARTGSIARQFPGGSIANRTSWFCNFSGPSVVVDTMCSSSLTAIHLACQSLVSGECEVAIAGGVNVSSHPNKYLFLAERGFASSKGRCESFGEGGDGYVPGEGVGTVLLKQRARAEQDGDQIYGVIRATAVNHGGKTSGYTVPNAFAQGSMIERALQQTGIDARAVSYIEAHGTGTSLGDPIEIAGLTRAFRRSTADTQFCAIGSVKSNIGHCESAAGIAGVTKVLLQMQHGQLAPSLHAEVLNPHIDFANSPFVVQRSLAEWRRPVVETAAGAEEHPRIAGVSSFGAGGSNAHVVIEEYVGPARPTVTVAPAAIVLSAKNEARLRERAEQLVAAINARLLTDADLGDVAFTLQVGREAMEARLGLLAGSMAEVLRKLQAYLAGEEGIEDFYRGEVKRNKEALTVLAADDDMAQTIEAWVAKGKYGKLLDLWVKGLTFDWRGLYGDRLPRRISLPTYPFARERYWVSAAPSGTAPAQVAAGVGALHPLVHRNTSDLWGQRFSSTFRGDEFFLSDHVVGGARVLPGVAYLELARAAVEHSAGEEAAGGVLLKHVVWARPLVAGESGLEVHVALYPEDDGELGYAIYDAVVDEAGEPVIHGQGRAVLAHPGERPVLDVSALAGRCGERVVSGEDCYGAFRGMGLEYGPAHRGLESVAVGHDGSGRPEVLARVVLPGCVAATREQYVLHPSVLDCALQGLIGLSLDAQTGSERTYLPFAVEEVRVWSACADCGWAWVRLSAGGSLADAVRKVDVDVCDEQGAVCVRLSGFSVRALEREIASSAGEAQSDTFEAPSGTQTRPVSEIAPVELGGASPAPDEEPVILPAGMASMGDVLQQYTGAPIPAAAAALRRDEASERDEILGRVLWGQLNGMGLGEIGAGSLAEIKRRLGVIDLYERWLEASLALLVKWGRLELADGIYTVVPGSPSDAGLDWQEWEARKESWLQHPDVSALGTLGEQAVRALPDILTGRRRATDVLFPGGSMELVEGLYKNNVVADYFNAGVADLVVAFVEARLAQDAAARIRILEVGAGTGGTSVGVFAKLKPYQGHIAEYCYTDLSQAFLKHARNSYGPDASYLDARILDLERPIAAQGFELGRYDVVIATNVVHATRNIRRSLRNAKALLRTHGVLLLNEMSDNTLFSLLVFGLLEGWWLYEDAPLRIEGSPVLTPETWSQVLAEEGYGPVLLPFAHARNLGQQIIVAESNGVVRQVAQTRSAAKAATGLTATAVGDLLQKMRRALVVMVSRQLKVKAEDIDLDRELSEYGLDSISATEWIKQLNDRYGLELSPTVVFEYPTLGKLARHLADQHGDVLAAQFASSSVATPTIEGRAGKASKAGLVRPQRLRGMSRRVVSSRRKDSPGDDLEAVAVIGMSGCFPMAPDIDTFWRNLVEGRDCISEIPPERWDWRDVYGDPAVQAGKTNVKYGGFIAGVDEFDPLFFGISPREAELMDPQQRLLMTHIWKAIEDAGYPASDLSGSRTAVFVGAGIGEYAPLLMHSGMAIDDLAVTGMSSSAGPNRMSYLLDLHGPSGAIESACSSSLVAIHRGVQALEDDACAMAIVGGVNTLLTPALFVGYGKAGLLSVDGRCKTFSKDANGFARGEGVGILVLKKRSAAETAGDHIYGVIRGSAENHGGRAQSLVAPNPNAQAELLKMAYTRAGIDARTVSYIEAHGTGTLLGDPIEIDGLKRAFKDLCEGNGGRADAEAYCGLGTGKTNVGHLEFAAGVTGVIKVLLQLQRRTLVKSLHSEEINPYIQLEGSPFYIVRETGRWEALKDDAGRALPRRAGVSAFGIRGVNAHVVIEEYVPPARESVTADPAVIVLSAKNEARLRERAQQFVAAITSRTLTDADLADVAFTLQVGREPMEARLGFLAGSMADMRRKLEAYLAGEDGVESVYRGEAKRNTVTLGIFSANEELSEAVDKWVQRGKYGPILDLWVKGLSFDWRRLYGDRTPQRISLPTYPFARERHWAPEAFQTKAAAQARKVDSNALGLGAGQTAVSDPIPADALSRDVADRRDTLVFVETCEVVPPPQPQSGPVRTVVFVMSDPAHAACISAALDDVAGEVALAFIVTAGAGGDDAGGEAGSSDLRAFYERELSSIAKTHSGIDAIVYLAALANAASPTDYSNILCLLQAMRSFAPECRRLVLCGKFTRPLERCYLESWLGFDRSLELTWPQVKTTVLGFEASLQTDAPLPQEWIATLWSELIADRPESVLFMGGERHVYRLRPKTLQPSGRSAILHGGTYLITGGCGGVGFLFAQHLATTHAANLILVGRSAPNPDIQHKLALLEQAGVTVVYLPVNVGDRVGLEEGIRTAEAKAGVVSGIIHAAGLQDVTIVFDKTPSSFRKILVPKLDGAIALHDIFRHRQLDFVCHFSSSAAVIGDFGSCDYAIANRFLMAFTRLQNDEFEHFGTSSKAFVINWGMWRDFGMAASADAEQIHMYLKSSGQGTLDPEEGLDVFERLLNQADPQHLVLAGDRNRVSRFLHVAADATLAESGRVRAAPRQVVRTTSPLPTGEWRAPSFDQLLKDMRCHVSEILKVPYEEIDVQETFADYGLDSIALVELANRLTQHFGIEVPPTLFFGYPTLERLAAHLMEARPPINTVPRIAQEAKPIITAEQLTGARQPRSPQPRPVRSIRTGSSGRMDGTRAPEPLAIIGMSGRFPSADNISEFWNILATGKDVIEDFTRRTDNGLAQFLGYSTAQSRSYRAGLVQGIDEFDPLFF